MVTRDDAPLDAIFRCLADPTRRRIFAELGRRPGTTTADLTVSEPRISRWAVMKHLAVLRDAGLIQTLPRGRSRYHYRVERNLGPLQDWLDLQRDAIVPKEPLVGRGLP